MKIKTRRKSRASDKRADNLRNSQEKIKEAKEYAESIIKTVREPLIVLNGHLKVISANSSFYKVFKVSKKETIGNKIYNLSNRQWNIPELRKFLEEILPKKTIFKDFEVTHKFKDIGEMVMLLNAQELKRKVGRKRLILLAIEDITEKKKAQEKVRKARDFAENIIATLREPLLILDKNLRVVSANRSFYTNFEVGEKETIGTLLTDLGNSQWNIPKLLYLLKEILPKKITIEDFEVEHDFKTIGHKIMNLNVRRLRVIPSLLKKAEEEMILLAIEDITEKRKSEEISRKLATIGKLAATMNHEIKNILWIIINSVYFLNMRLKGSMDEKVKKHLNILQTEINNANKIISDILSFVRIKSPSYIKTEINSVVKESIFRASIPKIVKTQTKLGKNLPKIKIDIAQIKQVFLNIIINAFDAMPKGGELKITTKQSDKFISIAFKDTSVGIPKENIKKIFDPLFTTKAKGFGLGLAGCQDIINGHKGKIEVESHEGKGATFTIKLPIV